ncbi:MAG: hypothetical protein KA200_01750, partial [Burkholderiales bacterium]|nr:hypothetical protein [Burkholderiales bacterium]
HRLVQDGEARVVLELVARCPPVPGDLERLRREGARCLGEGVRFDVVIVDGFAREPGRKFRPYVVLGGRDGPDG